MLGAPPDTADTSAPSPGVPALASYGLKSWLRAEPQPAIVMGTSTRFAWCALEDEVILLASPGAVRFPNAILAGDGWDVLEPGERILIGSGALLGERFDWRVVRWWDPRVRPIGAKRSDVMAQVSSMSRHVAPSASRLEGALASGDRNGVIDAALGMLGAGGGLTPEGDDALIGAFAAYRHVTSSLGYLEGRRFIDDAATEILSVAARRTTLLSVTLLRHACAGEVPDPVADLLRAVTGIGSTSAAIEQCVDLGGSSGRAMAEGVVSGARAGCGMSS